MKFDTKTVLTIAAIAVVLILFLSYLNAGSEEAKDPEVKDDVVVGDYITLGYAYYSHTLTEDGNYLDSFYSSHFHYDIDDMTYVKDVKYDFDGKKIDCEVYNKNNTTVYVTKDSKMRVYLELAYGDAKMSTQLTECSLDIVKGFGPEDIKQGMTFNVDSVIPLGMTGTSHYKVVSVDGNWVDFTDRTDSELVTESNYEVVEVNGDSLVLDSGDTTTKEHFMNLISKEYMFDEICDKYDVKTMATYVYEVETFKGTYEGLVDEILASGEGIDIVANLYYVGDILFKTEVSTSNDQGLALTVVTLNDTSMIV